MKTATDLPGGSTMLETKITDKNDKELKALVSCDFFNRMDEKVTSKEISIDFKISSDFYWGVSFLPEPSAA